MTTANEQSQFKLDFEKIWNSWKDMRMKVYFRKKLPWISKSRIQNFHNCLNESERVLFGLKKTANEQKSICLRKYMFFKLEIRETMQWSAPLFRKWFLTFKILQKIFFCQTWVYLTRKINTYVVGKNQGKRKAIGILVF